MEEGEERSKTRSNEMGKQNPGKSTREGDKTGREEPRQLT
ncbi:hypothetical protein CTAM01_02072 [Colletotrichum tamarilloi]|uniref:Uncharacterized protein n=1 Tax=Colletotrichum tamarilloi TaxID=1209934 RepID=A0ABQ9RR51_9PEZI|nr:uncharacterized protein CTAM01_02072 [Colletotrichum tamarilloi]KAK1509949.1 hypothetical protein CTAM01_02072 [Colletotrichum tamarilloi]